MALSEESTASTSAPLRINSLQTAVPNRPMPTTANPKEYASFPGNHRHHSFIDLPPTREFKHKDPLVDSQYGSDVESCLYSKAARSHLATRVFLIFPQTFPLSKSTVQTYLNFE